MTCSKVISAAAERDNREVKRHVYVKREFVPRDQVSSFTCLLLFIISTHKLVVFKGFFFLHKNHFEVFLSAQFFIWEILNLNFWRLLFAVYVRLKGDL